MPTTGDINNSLNTAVADSLNETNEDNSVNVDLGATDSFNETNTETVTNDTTIGVDGSFNEGSNNESTVITDSGNDNSDNSDNSVDLDWTEGSYNEYTDASSTDNSVNAGVREYNTGVWGGAGSSSAAAAGSGHTEIWSSSTIVDQSVNQNLAVDGGVDQSFDNSSVTASGEGSIAAGGNVDWDYSVDESSNFSAGGDINIGNETTITTITDSMNEYNLDYSYTDSSTVIDVTDSFNDFSENYSADGSFNTSEVFESDTAIDVDITAVVDSFNTADLNLPLA
ncbi:hypothetical protein [Microbacterium sp. Leaf151]|uniref:hypothetical protein n=1 Tax=Microbacterium sp. Leaf151 TaxID=1736276 RepID=UPI0006FCE6C3|nr:hypothetical protein [Microbacterium sp. Leaf151]KQR21388.1 hypothetical protein ASF76_14150 [Microbacterium sp. Leaf151]